MRKETINKAALAALIVLAPGGFVLAATLAARRYRARQAEAAGGAEASAPDPAE
jgi:uncharacterized membrane protein YjjB (DUF3815 family)